MGGLKQHWMVVFEHGWFCFVDHKRSPRHGTMQSMIITISRLLLPSHFCQMDSSVDTVQWWQSRNHQMLRKDVSGALAAGESDIAPERPFALGEATHSRPLPKLIAAARQEACKHRRPWDHSTRQRSCRTCRRGVHCTSANSVV